MFENIANFLKKFNKKTDKTVSNSKEAAKERLHLVLMQDRANVSADFLELMKQEIIEVIKKYIDVDEKEIDVRLTNKENSDGTNGAPALYANIPILNIKNEARKVELKDKKEKETKDLEFKENVEEKTENKKDSKEESEKEKKKQNDEKDINEKEKKNNKEENQDEKLKNNNIDESEKRKIKVNAKEKSRSIN